MLPIITQQKYIKSFQRASKDLEMLELADQGLSDFFQQLSLPSQSSHSLQNRWMG